MAKTKTTQKETPRHSKVRCQLDPFLYCGNQSIKDSIRLEEYNRQSGIVVTKMMECKRDSPLGCEHCITWGENSAYV